MINLVNLRIIHSFKMRYVYFKQKNCYITSAQYYYYSSNHYSRLKIKNVLAKVTRRMIYCDLAEPNLEIGAVSYIFCK